MFDPAPPSAAGAGICAMAVMAKAPQPGRAKTRLTSVLAPDAAAGLSAAFLRDITENIALARRAVPIHGWAAYAPAGAAGLFEGLLAPATRLVLADGVTAVPADGVTAVPADGMTAVPADGTGDFPAEVQGFGRCLLQAMQALFAMGYGAVCVVNSDSPTLPTAYLARAARLLAAPGDRAVLGQADDGGYYLLGLKSAHAHMFADIAWSTGAVAAQTAARARESGLEFLQLPLWYDVDDAPALARLRAELTEPPPGLSPYAAPATRACLQRLGLLTGQDEARAP